MHRLTGTDFRSLLPQSFNQRRNLPRGNTTILGRHEFPVTENSELESETENTAAQAPTPEERKEAQWQRMKEKLREKHQLKIRKDHYVKHRDFTFVEWGDNRFGQLYPKDVKVTPEMRQMEESVEDYFGIVDDRKTPYSIEHHDSQEIRLYDKPEPSLSMSELFEKHIQPFQSEKYRNLEMVVQTPHGELRMDEDNKLERKKVKNARQAENKPFQHTATRPEPSVTQRSKQQRTMPHPLELQNPQGFSDGGSRAENVNLAGTFSSAPNTLQTPLIDASVDDTGSSMFEDQYFRPLHGTEKTPPSTKREDVTVPETQTGAEFIEAQYFPQQVSGNVAPSMGDIAGQYTRVSEDTTAPCVSQDGPLGAGKEYTKETLTPSVSQENTTSFVPRDEPFTTESNSRGLEKEEEEEETVSGEMFETYATPPVEPSARAIFQKNETDPDSPWPLRAKSKPGKSVQNKLNMRTTPEAGSRPEAVEMGSRLPRKSQEQMRQEVFSEVHKAASGATFPAPESTAASPGFEPQEEIFEAETARTRKRRNAPRPNIEDPQVKRLKIRVRLKQKKLLARPGQ